MNLIKKYLGFVILSCLSMGCYAQRQPVIYVSPHGSDNNNGSFEKPLLTIEKAKDVALEQRRAGLKNIDIILRGGIYELSKPLTFENVAANGILCVKAYNDERPIISGGKLLPKKWVKQRGNIWKLNVKELNIATFRNLFNGDQRLERTRSSILYTKGPLPKFAHSFKRFDFNKIQKLIRDSIQAVCGFQYRDLDLEGISDLKSAEFLVYNSWEASWQTFLKLDRQNKSVFFKNPTHYPVGYFNNRMPYVVENSKDFLNAPGKWCLDYTTGDLWYYAKQGEDPNRMNFIAPRLDRLIVIKGTNSVNVKNIIFEGIQFSYTTSAWGVSEVAGKEKVRISKANDWVDFNEGFSSRQAALGCGEAILLYSAEACKFKKCVFSHIGNYAIRIGQYSSQNSIINSSFFDNGGGGVIIGFDKKGGRDPKIPDEAIPNGNTIEQSKIYDCGKMFISSVGIGIMQSRDNVISGNEIYNMPYSGISVGWTWGTAENYTTGNKIINNKIHDVMTYLADGGGIYTLGRQDGTIIANNEIFNIIRNKNAVGSGNEAIFFDEGSSAMTVENNRIYNVNKKFFRYNRTEPAKLNLKTNSLH